MMIYVNGGSFAMGTLNGMADERPVHNVTLSSFYIDTTAVTQESWVKIMGENPSYFSANPAEYENQMLRPVERVSQYDAFIYCNKRSKIEGLTPCYTLDGTDETEKWGAIPKFTNDEWNKIVCHWNADGYRLPTEAEWEYAARGGHIGVGLSQKINDDESWNKNNSAMITHAVGMKKPNLLGLHDMFGNVWEWCWDWYTSYKEDDCINPRGTDTPDSSADKIGRGGAWNAEPSDCTPFFRNGGSPAARYSFIGFRVVRSSSE